MKLRTRVPLLIIPVLFTSFLLLVAGIFFVERRTVHNRTMSALEMEATELAGSFSQYSLAARGMLASVIQSDSLRRFLDSSDDYMRSLALGGGVDSILRSISHLKSDHFSILILSMGGKQEYYYENSLDPFAEPQPETISWVQNAFSEGKTSATVFLEINDCLILSQVIDKLTLKPVNRFDDPNSLALILSISPTDYVARAEELEDSTKSVEFFNKGTEAPPITSFEVRRGIPGVGYITLKVSPESVQAQLNSVILKITLILALLLLLTYVALQWLLQKHVVNPILDLDRQLKGIDLDETEEITTYQSKDEIGSLSRSFADLYSQLKKTYEGTKELAEKDSLTALYNRRVFHLTLTKLIKRAERGRTSVCLMYIDIDNFKYVNDQYGHATGDALLKEFAIRLHETVRGSDIILPKNTGESTIARLAGDEFAVIIHGFTEESAVSKIASRLLDICKDGFSFDGTNFPISLSIGIATYPHDGVSTDELTVNADSAMYESKKSGKNSISYYSKELSDMARRQKQLEVSLKKLPFDEFEIYYMPIVDSATHEIHTFEALVRWFSPTLSFVSPAEFIPLAESMGIYREIDFWVLEQAFSHLPLLTERHGSEVGISINISAAELGNSSFLAEILHLVDKYDVAPGRFTLEITETFYQDHSENELEMLTALTEKGFRLAIDDLGSGYSSLIQLVEFPVETVKLDRTFVDKMLLAGKVPLLKSLVDFCQAQQLTVTAEGVETQEVMEALVDAGCNYLQGYYFSRPCPLKDILDPSYKI